jgi:hypothetical protein
MALSTLPQISFKLGISLDLLREVVREDPRLREMGTVVGANRGYSPEEIERIKEAAAARKARKAAKRGMRATA